MKNEIFSTSDFSDNAVRKRIWRKTTTSVGLVTSALKWPFSNIFCSNSRKDIICVVIVGSNY